MALTNRCIVIEDEPAAQQVIERFIEQTPSLQLLQTFNNAIDAGEFLKTEMVDLLFLDINLPELSGISFLKTMSNPPAVIFTTAYPEHAVEGFDLNALDYLLKPYPFERFLKAVNKFQQFNQTLENKPSDYIIVNVDKKLVKTAFANIMYLEAYGDYVKVITKNTTLIVHKTLAAFLKTLPKNMFLQVHRSFVINLQHLDHIEGNQIAIHGSMLPIGKKHKALLLEKIMK